MQLQAAIRPDLPPEMRQDVDNYFSSVNDASAPVPTESEDCKCDCVVVEVARRTHVCVGLTINVQVPEGAKAGDKLPVIAVSRAESQYSACLTLRLVHLRRLGPSAERWNVLPLTERD